MDRFSKKDEHEKDKEEAERNVRKSPKKKPPRADKTRRRMKKEDPDVDGDPDTEDDDDLSMNYKDIGGSLVSSVAHRFLFAADEKEEKKEGEDEKEEGDDKPSGFPSQDEKDDDSEDDKKDEGKDEKDQEDKKKDEEKSDKSNIEERAKKVYEEGIQALVTVDNKKVLGKAVEMMKKVLPPEWDPDKAFDAGVLTLDARKELRKHISNWDRKTLEDNLTALKKSQLDVFLENPTDKQEHYHAALRELFEEEKQKLVDQEIKPPEDLDGFVSEGLEGELDRKTEKAIKKAIPVWWDYLRVMSLEKTREIKKEIEKSLGELDSLSARYAALSVLKNFVRGALEMKNDEKNKEARMLVSSIRKGFRKEAEYRGLPGPLDMSDGHKPPVTHWQKPDPRDMRMQDYMSIIKSAIDWYSSDYLKHDLVEYKKEAACRAALDYAIWDSKNGLYDGNVDVPTYNQLLDALLSITSGQ